MTAHNDRDKHATRLHDLVALSLVVTVLDDDATRAALNAGAAALRAPQETGWQPIATAPKGRQVIWGWEDGDAIFLMRYIEEWAEPWATVPGMHPRKPTRWMPLPSPPAPSQET
jgi:hypothetical protein